MTLEPLSPTTPTVSDLMEPETDSWTAVVQQVADLANRIANTDFVPKEYRGSPGQIAATILHGRELGLPPMTALALTNPVKGRPAISAEGMRSLVQQAGHDIELVEATSARVVMRGRRVRRGILGHGDPTWTTVAWTMEDAKRAGIVGGANWRNYPRQMLIARATAELCRVVFADVIHGLRAAEELADELDQLSDPTPTPAIEAEPTTKVQRRPKAAKKAAPKPKPDEPAEPVEAPARKRVDVPAPRPASKPEPDQAPADDGPSVEEQQAEIRRLAEERRQLQDADNPEPDDQAPDDVETADGRTTGTKITNRQNSALMMHWGRLSMMQDRDERLLATNVLLGYEPGTIGSTTELRGAEAAKLLAVLERFKDRDQLDLALSGQDQLTD